ncbi:hypothetical protein [Natronococcus wangiae]|uniref:hypothetical protein n=1 Tax=Natronococcus wangiae TaxID=3068275 RepID=UPI00273EF6AB|nr:hypothetical protein [Natronococcus sp. AD5]
MNDRRLRSVYLLGIGLNALAMVYAVEDGAPLFAVTFALVVVYLGARYWMVSSSDDSER